MRRALAMLHRWFGLFTATFLFVAGLTGAIIAWDHELDGLLNPELFHAEHGPSLLAPTELARRLEADDPRLHVSYLPLSLQPDHTLMVSVVPRIDPHTQQPYELDFDQVALDPNSGERRGERAWGEPSLARKNLLPFIYRLHYSLHLPTVGGIDSGMLLLGFVALVWTLDAFVALYISFPNRKVWRKSFAFRFGQGARKLNFDLHRSSGVWLWPVLLVFAVTAVSMNLQEQLVRPLVSIFSPLAPNPLDVADHGNTSMLAPKITREQILSLARAEAANADIQAPLGSLYHSSEAGVYAVSFFEPGADHGDGGLGNPELFFDAESGALRARQLPGEGSAGDLFMALQFPLHSGRILGVAGRIFVTVLGLLIALLSATGVIIWARKRQARVVKARRTDELAPVRPVRVSHPPQEPQGST